VTRRGRLAPRLLLTGELQAARAVDLVVPRNPSWQVQLRWLEADGVEVAAGQRLFELDNTAVAANLHDRRLQAQKAVDELDRLVAQLQAEAADKVFAVESARVARAKADSQATVPAELLSRHEHEERQLALERARLALLKAEEELAAFRRGAEADLAVQRLQVEKTRREIQQAELAIAQLAITAPRQGILIVADHPWEGRKLQANDIVGVGMTLGRLPDLTSLEVEAGLPDVDDGALAPGSSGSCTLDAYPDTAYPCEVAEITPVARQPTALSLRRSFRVRLALARLDVERMRPGMSVKVEIASPAAATAVLAPRAGLDLGAEPPRARLAAGGEVVVRLGACSAHECEVVEGLADGARLRGAPRGPEDA
jgi:multidrug resistance efflux pump